jgi:hypothetical protein
MLASLVGKGKRHCGKVFSQLQKIYKELLKSGSSHIEEQPTQENEDQPTQEREEQPTQETEERPTQEDAEQLTWASGLRHLIPKRIRSKHVERYERRNLRKK